MIGETPTLRPRETIGDLLRRTRVELGGEIAGVAAILRIRAEYIAAIEQARYDRLPGPVYALGFVRTYALHLGLDGDEAVRRFKQESTGLETKRDLSFPVPLTPRSIPGGRMLLAAFVLAVCAYGIWHYLSTGDRNRPERVAAVPTSLLPPPPPLPAVSQPAPPPGPSEAAAPSPETPPAAPPQTAASGPAPAATTSAALPPPPATAFSVPAPTTSIAVLPPPAPPAAEPDAAASPTGSETAPQTVTQTVTQTGGAHVYGAIGGPSRITLRAIKDSWIQVRDADAGQAVVSQRTLRAGDTYRVPDRAGLQLRTGNATGLQILVDDKAVPALNGTVRTVALDPTRLIAGSAPVE